MKKALATAGLIMLTLLIWAAIFYKHFGKKNSKNTANIDKFENKLYQDTIILKKQDFEFYISNENPFKVFEPSKTKNIQPNQRFVQKRKKISPPKKTTLKWPKITYHGFVKGESKESRLVLVKIDDLIHRKRENEYADGILIVEASNDSLVVELNQIKKTIAKLQ